MAGSTPPALLEIWEDPIGIASVSGKFKGKVPEPDGSRTVLTLAKAICQITLPPFSNSARYQDRFDSTRFAPNSEWSCGGVKPSPFDDRRFILVLRLARRNSPFFGWTIGCPRALFVEPVLWAIDAY